ncbi:MAG TPA: sugar phosphate isomerase/epimerase [Armatimonadota bacterium]|nr:sugar phosphate isomerase/epimerase [Armatimonadota bacterium]
MMFKLGVFTDEISQDFEHAVQVAQEYRLQTVEIRSAWDKRLHQLSDDDVARIMRILEPTGIKVSIASAQFYKCDIDDDEACAEHLRIFARCLEIAPRLGTDMVRGFTFWNTGHTDEIWGKLLERYQQPVEMAATAGIILAIENEAACSVSNARYLQRFLADINRPHVKALWDPANEVFADDGERPYPDAYHRVEKEMVHFHLKDARRDEQSGEPRCVAVGEGVINWQGQIKALLESGYSGTVSLETHWRPTQLSEEQLNRPGGAEFSSCGEYATRVCLDNLLRIVKQVTG